MIKLCRFCAKPIYSNEEYGEHLISNYGLVADLDNIQYYHRDCELMYPDSSSVKINHNQRRFHCDLILPKKALIIYEGQYLLVDITNDMTLSVTRNAKCKYFKHKLSIDIAEELCENFK